MKKFICIFSCMLMLILGGCSSYERDTSAGEVKKITVNEMQKKLENKETFAIVFTQSWCGHCKDLMAMLDTSLEDHHVILNDLILDMDPDYSSEEAVDISQKTFTDMTGTPTLYYVKDGEIASKLVSGEDGITEEKFDSWVQKNELDKKE